MLPGRRLPGSIGGHGARPVGGVARAITITLNSSVRRAARVQIACLQPLTDSSEFLVAIHAERAEIAPDAATTHESGLGYRILIANLISWLELSR